MHEGKCFYIEQASTTATFARLSSCAVLKGAKVPRDTHERARDVARSFAGADVFERSRCERKKIEMRFAHTKAHPEVRSASTARPRGRPG
jgi:hypothetical protein